MAAACDRGCPARSWLTGHRDGTKIIGHKGAGVAVYVQQAIAILTNMLMCRDRLRRKDKQ